MNLKYLLIAVLATLLTGCAALQPTANVATAAIQFPACKAELEAYLPNELLATLNPEFERIESSVNAIVGAVQGDVDVSLATALRLADLTSEADQIETDFLRIVDFTVAYTVNGDRSPSQALVDCDATLRAGWKGIRDSGPAATVRQFLVVAGPYLKTGAKLLPLLVEADAADRVLT